MTRPLIASRSHYLEIREIASGTSYRNLALSHLATGDLALVEPHLRRVDLPLRHRLSQADRPIEHVYFLESGIASYTLGVHHRAPTEIGIIGREGVASPPAVLGMRQAPGDVFMQIAGEGHAVPAARLLTAMQTSPSLTRALLGFVHVFMVQTASTIAANARASASERLARWLLMARDRVDGPRIELTHEFLATMLGVRRATVSEAVHDFARQDLIVGHRGAVTILDREGLERRANGFYGSAESELRRLLDPR